MRPGKHVAHGLLVNFALFTLGHILDTKIGDDDQVVVLVQEVHRLLVDLPPSCFWSSRVAESVPTPCAGSSAAPSGHTGTACCVGNGTRPLHKHKH